MLTYFLNNISAKNYQNRFTYSLYQSYRKPKGLTFTRTVPFPVAIQSLHAKIPVCNRYTNRNITHCSFVHQTSLHNQNHRHRHTMLEYSGLSCDIWTRLYGMLPSHNNVCHCHRSEHLYTTMSLAEAVIERNYGNWVRRNISNSFFCFRLKTGHKN